MRLVLGVILISTLYFTAHGQEVELRGKMVHGDTEVPIAYANIGIPGQNIGTVSDSTGSFSLDIPAGHTSDSLKFSSIGYTSILIPISVLTEREHPISMTPITYELDAINISATKSKRERTGTKSRGLGGVVAQFKDRNLGAEFAYLMKARRYPSLLQDFRFFIYKNEHGQIRLKVNVYDVRDGIPGENLLRETIIIETGAKKGWVTCDLESYGLVMRDHFFISLEWLEDTNPDTDRSLYLGGRLLGKKQVWYRPTSHGKWTKSNSINVVMNATVYN